MKWGKITINIAVITLAFLLFVLWHRNNIEAVKQTSISNIKHYTVYLITTDKVYEYWNILNKGAEDMAAAVGVKYVWDAPAERNVDEQIKIINNAVDHNADALLVAADDPKLISGAIEDAKAKGVKVIYVDSPAYEEPIITLATDNYKAGALAGETMISLLEESGIGSGSIGIVSLAAKANADLRERGFRDALKQDTRYKVLETIYMETDEPELILKEVERMKDQNEDLVALFGTNEGTSAGVGYANKANNNKFVGVGFDKTEVMTRLLKEGSLKAIIDQNPYTMGYLGMAQAIAALLGKDTGPDYIDTGVSVVTKN